MADDVVDAAPAAVVILCFITREYKYYVFIFIFFVISLAFILIYLILRICFIFYYVWLFYYLLFVFSFFLFVLTKNPWTTLFFASFNRHKSGFLTGQLFALGFSIEIYVFKHIKESKSQDLQVFFLLYFVTNCWCCMQHKVHVKNVDT